MQKTKDWFKGLSRTGQVTVTSVVLLLAIGTVGSMAQPGELQPVDAETANPVQAEPDVATPVVTYKEEAVIEEVPFTSSTVEDASLAIGTSQTRTIGVNGQITKTYRLTVIDGKETGRELISDAVTTPVVNEVVVVGTYVKPAPAPRSSCDANYSGCVPIASDVDCSGGSGNGPAYVAGPVQVIGSDIYDLDRDGNGYGCE